MAAPGCICRSNASLAAYTQPSSSGRRQDFAGPIVNRPLTTRESFLSGQALPRLHESPKVQRSGIQAAIEERNASRYDKAALEKQQAELAARIAAGEFSAAKRVDRFAEVRKRLAERGPPGRALAKVMADIQRGWRTIASDMPEARGDIREIVGQPVFVPLYRLFLAYGGVFRLSFGPKSFVVISDPAMAKYVLFKNAKNYTKGILSEILEFVMGTGLIPADGEIWRTRRRAVVPSLHKQYVAAMIKLFGESTDRLCVKLAAAEKEGKTSEMESLFSRMALDIIGKAVFNYKFDSLSHDTGIVEAVYTTLKEAEYRSIAIFPYWKIAPLRRLVPRQRKVTEALNLINSTLDNLIAECKRMVDEEDDEFTEEYVNEKDPSILHFLLASGDDITGKQLRDDLMTMLIAGHETTAAVLTWTFFLLEQHPEVLAKLQAEVDTVLGDRWPAMEDMRRLKYTTRVINESMRLYPQPPVLIRRSVEEDTLGGFKVRAGQDIFISVWNLHRSPLVWDRAEEFWPERWPVDGPDPSENTENFAYLPFGGGPRKCVGDQFALFESIVAVAMLVRRFDFKMAPDAPPVGMTTGATIHTTQGLNMVFTSRKVPLASETKVAGSEVDGAANGAMTSVRQENGAANGAAASGHEGNGAVHANVVAVANASSAKDGTKVLH